MARLVGHHMPGTLRFSDAMALTLPLGGAAVEAHLVTAGLARRRPTVPLVTRAPDQISNMEG